MIAQDLTHIQALLPSSVHSAAAGWLPGSRRGGETIFEANEMRTGSYEPVSTGAGRS